MVDVYRWSAMCWFERESVQCTFVLIEGYDGKGRLFGRGVQSDDDDVTQHGTPHVTPGKRNTNKKRKLPTCVFFFTFSIFRK